MTRRWTLIVLAVFFAASGGCSAGEKEEIKRLRGQLRKSNVQNERLSMANFRMTDYIRQAESQRDQVKQEFDQFRGENEIRRRAHTDLIAKIAWTEKRLEASQTTTYAQLAGLAKAAPDTAVARALVETAKGLRRQVELAEARLARQEKEVVRLRKLCTDNKINFDKPDAPKKTPPGPDAPRKTPPAPDVGKRK